jgi:hypothetical protein
LPVTAQFALELFLHSKSLVHDGEQCGVTIHDLLMPSGNFKDFVFSLRENRSKLDPGTFDR